MVDNAGSALSAKNHFIGTANTAKKKERKSGLKGGSLRDIQYASCLNIAVTVEPNCIGSSATGFLAPCQKIRVLLKDANT